MKKTINDRLQEVVSIRKKLDMFGLTSAYPQIKEFQKTLSEYVRNGVAQSGKFRVSDTDRILQYILPEQARHQCSVKLVYCP